MLLFGCSSQAFGYSLLTHEQLIDLTWDDSIVPLLLSRYPGLTPKQLDEARAFAYGGCVIQDIGYYPYGQRSFSNLTHYVRSGDFVVNLFRNARDADELAFAVGALSHYIGDTFGHSLATNRAVPAEFPKLRARYGPAVNYAQGKDQHVQVEFAFDIDEIAHNRMAPLKYLRHIGLGVSMRQLSLAYYQTYGLSANFSGTRKQRVNAEGYRFAVHAFIPRIAYALTLLHRRREPQDANTPEALQLHEEIAAMAAANNWSAYTHHAGIGTWSLAIVLFVLPKVGPLKLAAIKGPTESTEAEYVHSLSIASAEMRRVLLRFTPPAARGRAVHANYSSNHVETSSEPSRNDDVPREARDPRHPLPNRDLDTGKVVQPGGYRLTDSTYADLLHSLVSQPNVAIPPGIKEDILNYYANPNAPIATKKDPQRWAQVRKDLATLSAMPTSPLPEVFPTYENEGQE